MRTRSLVFGGIATTFGLSVVLAGEPDGTKPAPSADVKKLAGSETAFACDIYGKLRDRKGNLACSPESLSLALAMLHAGAAGHTREELASALHFTQDDDTLHRALAELGRGRSGEGSEVHIANGLFTQQGRLLTDEYVSDMETIFGAKVDALDFAGDPEGSRKRVNDWAAKETRDRIQDLFPEGTISNETRLVLADAIYLKGQWVHAFDAKATRAGDFHVAADRTVQASFMMHSNDSSPWAGAGYAHRDEAGGYSVLDLPLKGDLSMTFLLPDAQDGVSELEKHLDPALLANALGSLGGAPDEILLPRFQLETHFDDLVDQLQALGIKDAFGANADFSGIDGRHELHVNEVVQKAFVHVDEDGAEAAASTGVDLKNCAPPSFFRADHPFLFVIRDGKTGSIVFLGRVTDPTSS